MDFHCYVKLPEDKVIPMDRAAGWWLAMERCCIETTTEAWVHQVKKAIYLYESIYESIYLSINQSICLSVCLRFTISYYIIVVMLHQVNRNIFHWCFQWVSLKVYHPNVFFLRNMTTNQWNSWHPTVRHTQICAWKTILAMMFFGQKIRGVLSNAESCWNHS